MQTFSSVEKMDMNKVSRVLGSLVLPGVVVLSIGLLFALSNLSLAQQGAGWPSLPDSSAPPAVSPPPAPSVNPSPAPSPAPIEVTPSPAPSGGGDVDDGDDDDGKGKGKKKGKGHEKGKGKGHEHHDD
ncbi:MAG TPA: hypothetical protein ACFYEA_00980 [Candidatus Tripitaka californicus]|uniref:hypothetical protein n=2 Tax=Candidatus Tripitaka californicus TaxID=3367616 RepID=UPI004024CD58